ncbi:hypothetical protein GCM10008023_20480 [Sphingomonas glacialis]|uniref:Uncharacterized protein n=1 Tax=Sphingomonas glacialis TaxID=658225 RepID=A0ABQ3LK01_9SPHN|nr:hypothetical protein [Sphingomonas glacialis]GHH16448.1 hypothetical protein GCM10008023_20480 [Sphingomonas glacialis]
MPTRATALIACLVLAPLPAAAQTTESRGEGLVSALAACRTAAADQRLACYEQASAALISARDRHEIRIVDREAVQRAKRSLFGFSLPHLNLFGTGKEDPRADSDTDVREITSTVTSARQAAYGLWAFGLAEGGEWQSTAESPTFDPRKGDTVTIKAGMLGRYTAKIGKGRAVDVKRLR